MAPAVVEGLADGAERGADERQSADESVQEERVLLDRVLDQERQRSDATIDAARRARRVRVAAERQRAGSPGRWRRDPDAYGSGNPARAADVPSLPPNVAI